MKLTIKHMTQKKQCLWILMSILAVGCSNTSTSEKLDGEATPATLQFKVTNTPTTSMTSLSTSEATSMNITSGSACVSEIRLKAPEGLSCTDIGFVDGRDIRCETENEIEHGSSFIETQIKIAGPIQFNLVTGESTPSLGNLNIPSGNYRKIEFRFEKNCDGSDVNLQLNGTVKDSSADNHEFAMDLAYEDDIKLESSEDVQVIEGNVNQLFATLILSEWFKDVDLVGCIEDGDITADSNGIFQINSSTVGSGSCEDIYEDILDGIKDGFKFEGNHSSDDGVDHDINDDHGDDDEGHDVNDDHGDDDLVK